MNIIPGTIDSIQSNASLSIVKVRVGNEVLKTILIDEPDETSYLKVGNSIKMIFKETEVVIGKGDCHNISLQNKLAGNIIHIEKGQLLSKLSIETSVGIITSIITSAAVKQLQLSEGDEITAMIKTNETLLSR